MRERSLLKSGYKHQKKGENYYCSEYNKHECRNIPKPFLQSNSVNTDTLYILLLKVSVNEQGVQIKWVELFWKKCKSFLSPGTKQSVCENEVSVLSGCP